MTWMRIDNTLRDHPKVKRLARGLGVSPVQARGHLVTLWCWALDFAADGNLDGYEVDDIADAADWDGPADLFVSMLRAAKLLDGWQIHDWMERNETLKATQRQRKRRQKPGSVDPVTECHVTTRDSTVTCHAPVTEDRTGQDETGRDRTEERERPTATPPLVEAVTEYDRPDGPTPEAVVELWNETAAQAGCVPARGANASRRRRVQARQRSSTVAAPRCLVWWREYFARYARSSFLRGENDRGWRADFDFAVRGEDIVSRVLEGKYDDRPRAPPPRRLSTADRLAAEALELEEEASRGQDRTGKSGGGVGRALPSRAGNDSEGMGGGDGGVLFRGFGAGIADARALA